MESDVLRDICYRVWDGTKMIYPDRVYNVDLVWNKVGSWTLWDTSKREHELICGQFDSPKMELMEFTGIINQDNERLYEHDIVKFVDVEKGIGIIEFHEGSFILIPIIPKNGDVPKITKMPWHLGNLYTKLIGNKFENPELLEV